MVDVLGKAYFQETFKSGLDYCGFDLDTHLVKIQVVVTGLSFVYKNLILFSYDSESLSRSKAHIVCLRI